MSSPDLRISAVEAPLEAALSAPVDVSWTVTNHGTETVSGFWYNRIYLSDNSSLDNSDTQIRSWRIAPQTSLAPGESIDLTAELSFYGSLDTGDLYLVFVTDFFDSINESDETNNVVASPITLTMPDVDLIVSAASAPNQINQGETINVSWTVTNQGSEAALSFSGGEVYLSNDLIFDEEDDIQLEGEIINPLGQGIPFPNSLEAGTSYTWQSDIEIPNTANPGNQYLLFITNPYNYQAETNTQNNIHAIPINVQGSDLVVDAFTAPGVVSLGEEIDVSWTIKNQGLGTAFSEGTSGIRIYLSSDSTLDASDRYIEAGYPSIDSPLEPGAEYTSNSSIKIPGNGDFGDYYLLLVADDNNRIKETDETNNIYATPLTIKAPDLTISAVTSPSTAAIGESVSLAWTVINQGEGSAFGAEFSADFGTFTEPWWDHVYLSDDANFDSNDTYVTGNQNSEVLPLAPGGSYTISKDVVLPSSASGSNYLLFVTNRSGNQGESDTTNNVYAAPISLTGPDIVLTATTSPTTANIGESIAVTWTATNQGNESITGNWWDAVYLSSDATLDSRDKSLHRLSINNQTPLESGESYTANRTISILDDAVPGNQYLLFVADSDKQLGETNDSNNIYAAPINLVGPDLVVSDAVAPTTGILGETLSISWSITNQGSNTALGNWTDGVYLSNDTTFDRFDTLVTSQWAGPQTPLEPGSSYTFTKDITLPTTGVGDRYLLFVADKDNKHGETDETNNIYALPISLQAADLGLFPAFGDAMKNL